MKTILVEKLPRIIKLRRKLESILNVKITNRGKEVTVNGTPEDEYIAEKVIDALNFGFPFAKAIMIKEADFLFEIIHIKDFTKRHDLERIRARIIGKQARTIRTLEQLTKCFFELKDNDVGIIGDAEFIKNGQEGIVHLIKGSKQANVYNFLEKHQVKPVIDLGLKEDEKDKE